MTENSHAWKAGDRVQFHHMDQVFKVLRFHPADRFVELEELPGLFAAHLFRVAPIPPVEMEPITTMTSNVALAHSSYLPTPQHLVKPCPSCGGSIPSIDPQKLEALKVWYSLFAVLLDESALSETWLLAKLRELREQMRAQYPDAP